MWATVDDAVAPGSAWGPPLNVLSDTASILYRGGTGGRGGRAGTLEGGVGLCDPVLPETGDCVRRCPRGAGPRHGGNPDALHDVRDNVAGPAADVVRGLAEAFEALAAQRWAEAVPLLTRAMTDHARIGGSNAQRDLIDYALLNALLKQGRSDQAEMLLSMRRPLKVDAHAVAGL